MPGSHPSPEPASPHPRLTAALLVLAVALAWANSLTTPFLFDDISAVATNPTIRQLDTALTPPADGSTTTGRPLVNLSYALNYAVSGTATWSYHALNIAIHAAASLALFGLLRRTLGSISCRSLLAGDSASQSPTSRLLHTEPDLLAFTIALLWALHPLQTESVTSVSQRTESLCGLLYLVTLYCFARSTTAPRPGRWLVLSVLACLAGMAAKEVMVTAPLIVLLYDRTFVAGSFAGALRLRRGYYAALAATWLLLAWLVLGGSGTRGDAAGLGLGVSWWSYLLKQSEALVLYLKLSFWPHPLVIDYGGDVVHAWTEVWWQGPVVLALLAATIWALVRKPVLGFLGAWFFVILAPSSSVVPLISQTMAEHRMYLPLAAVLALVVGAATRKFSTRALKVFLVLALVAGGLTFRRNQVYQGELSLWSNTVAHRPANMRAHNNLGIALTELGRVDEALGHYQEAVRLAPVSADAHVNLCHALVRLGRAAEAVPIGETAVRLDPSSAAAQVNLATALAQTGRTADAITHYEEALRLEPSATDVPARLATAHYELGNRTAAAGDFAGAITRYRRALVLTPDYPAARNNLANALLMSGHPAEAITLYRQILLQRPDDAAVRENLARALELTR